MSNNNSQKDLPSSAMSLGDHLEELRVRVILAAVGLFVGVAAGLFFGKFVIRIMLNPYMAVMGDTSKLLVLTPVEGFMSYMKIAFISGLIISSPWVFYQIWMFVATGLYPKEKKYVYWTIPFSVILFMAGAIFFMLVIAPVTMGFLVKFNETVLDAASTFTFQGYISFITTLILVFGAAFQTPIVIFCLNKTGLVSLSSFQNSRKYVILAIVFIAGAATPGPDVISQIALAIPLYLLFELGIFLSIIFKHKIKN